MSTRTAIEWTDATWNPVRGCSRVSPGCTNCYAERVAARFSVGAYAGEGDGSRWSGPFAGFAENTPHGPRWTGVVALVEKPLLDPLRWRKPRRIFVNSMSDLFHESLPDEDISKVFAIMLHEDARKHTFQILTKRAERMRSVLSRMEVVERTGTLPPNIWLGVSAEDQERADERIPLLLQTPAAVRFVSAEPLLGPLDFTAVSEDPCVALPDELDWIIVGGESGPGARPCDLAWIRSIVAQCREAGVACFVKQLGTAAIDEDAGIVGAGIPLDHEAEHLYKPLRDLKGADPAEWPQDLRMREFPEVLP